MTLQQVQGKRPTSNKETLHKVGNTVTFRCGDVQKEGVVSIVDAHGTFEHPGIPSYDILVEEEGPQSNRNMA